eukprot:gnl/MRDRNA2_/MRDRNA2_86990_c0_seq1.p2 gnl/MRDRNA2_/MRDRNA2_86990_c0~~gnl/MRDRNA2_/MRDRNA2_86990_c0_seq1.p2  ORF type:complete len:107 (-),score=16.20 gnl/MRDRNA2_/MRDRNA2_86990_c0_seq1:332-652(-)
MAALRALRQSGIKEALQLAARSPQANLVQTSRTFSGVASAPNPGTIDLNINLNLSMRKKDPKKLATGYCGVLVWMYGLYTYCTYTPEGTMKISDVATGIFGVNAPM